MSNNTPKGIKNFELNCYMSSLLQCLYYIPELRNFFINNIDYFYKNDKYICLSFAEIMYKYYYNNTKTVDIFAILRFKQLMGEKNKLFKGYGGDAKDLYFNFIDLILDELTIKQNQDESSTKDEMLNTIDKEKTFLESEKEVDENNIINKIFSGFYETSYKCAHNEELGLKTYSFTHETFILFNLELISKHYNKDPLTIEDCLKFNFNRSYSSSFYCNVCNIIEKNKAEDKIYKPPLILVLILDRGHGKGFKGKVEFDLELDLKDFIDEDKYKNNSKYYLMGVINHIGDSSLQGHYTACCLTDNREFYFFNDEKSFKANQELLKLGETYLLFYRRYK